MKKKAFLYIALAGILWGTSGLFTSALAALGFTPVQMTAARGTVSLLVMLAFVLMTDPQRLRVPRKELPFLLGSGLGLFFTSYTYFASIEASSVSTAVILMYTAPVFVLIYSVTFLGERLNAVKGISVALMLAGCALVSGVMGGGLRFSTEGVLFGLGAGLSYSAYNIFTKLLTLHRVPAVTVTTYNFLIMALVGLAVADPMEMVQLAGVQPGAAIPLMLGIGVVTCILPYTFYTLGLRDIPAGSASALSIIEPLAATVFSVLFLGESLTAPLVIGTVLIIAAVLILARQKQ